MRQPNTSTENLEMALPKTKNYMIYNMKLVKKPEPTVSADAFGSAFGNHFWATPPKQFRQRRPQN